jgi:hypothetical protein
MGGISRQAAHHLVIAALEERRTQLAEDADDVRELELERIDRLFRRMLERLDSPRNDVPERTVGAIVKLMERRAALLGLDAPKDWRLGGLPGAPPLATSGGLDLTKMSVEDLMKLEELWSKYAAPLPNSAAPATPLPALGPGEVIVETVVEKSGGIVEP